MSAMLSYVYFWHSDYSRVHHTVQLVQTRLKFEFLCSCLYFLIVVCMRGSSNPICKQLSSADDFIADPDQKAQSSNSIEKLRGSTDLEGKSPHQYVQRMLIDWQTAQSPNLILKLQGPTDLKQKSPN